MGTPACQNICIFLLLLKRRSVIYRLTPHEIINFRRQSTPSTNNFNILGPRCHSGNFREKKLAPLKRKKIYYLFTSFKKYISCGISKLIKISLVPPPFSPVGSDIK